MKRKNKLPKYYLGTRMPTSLGYQPNYRVENQLSTSIPGLSIRPDIASLNSNIVPQAVNRAQQYGSNVYGMLSNTLPTAVLTNSSRKALNNYLVNSFNEAVNTGTITSKAPDLAYRTGLNTAGKALGVIGAAYGLGDMGLLLYHNQDHRTAGDMKNTLTTNTYTTDYGNTYTTHGGLDRSAELNYARAQRLNKNVNFTTTAIGTGATIGSFFPGWGTAIGAGVGALVGLGANWLGFGDTEEETRKAINQLGDTTAMGDKMSYSLALDKDAKQGFYSKGAAEGKSPEDAMVSNGETIAKYNKNTGAITDMFRIPGIPNNNDTVRLKGGNKPNTVVFTNLYGISDQAANGDPYGALQRQAVLLKMGMLKKYGTNAAKCGKLPKYWGGTTTLTILASVPHIGALLSNWEYYNKLNNADKSYPVEEISGKAANDIASRIMSLEYDARPYLNQNNDTYRQALYNNRQNVVLGPGGRAIFGRDLAINKMRADADILLKIDLLNKETKKEGLKLQFQNALDMREKQHDSWWRSQAARNFIIGKYNDLMALIPANVYNIGSSWANNLSNIFQFNDAMDIERDRNLIYSAQPSEDYANILADLQSMWNTLHRGGKYSTTSTRRKNNSIVV